MADVKKAATSSANEHVQPDHPEDRIRERAYRIWQSEGQPSGQHERHWFQAEEELAEGRPSVASRERDGQDIRPAKPERKTRRKGPDSSA